MPLRSPKMKSFIFGFQRLVWWPKCTPASSNSFMLTVGVTPWPGASLTLVDKPSSWSAAGRDGPEACRPPRGGSKFEWLTLAELEAAPRALLSVLLALLDAGVPGEEARLLEPLAQLQVELAQGPRD